MPTLRLPAGLLTGLSLFAATSCCRESDPEPALSDLAQVSYDQSQCADPWGFVRGTQQLETVATAYLVQQGIAFSQAKATQVNAGAVCAACTCPTGVVLVGTVPLSQLAAIQALGFKKK